MQFPRDDWTIRSVVTIIGFFQGTILFLPPPLPLSPPLFFYNAKDVVFTDRYHGRCFSLDSRSKKIEGEENAEGFKNTDSKSSSRARVIIYFFFSPLFFSMRHHPSTLNPSLNPLERFLTFREPFNVSTTLRKRERAATLLRSREAGEKKLAKLNGGDIAPAFFGEGGGDEGGQAVASFHGNRYYLRLIICTRRNDWHGKTRGGGSRVEH